MHTDEERIDVLTQALMRAKQALETFIDEYQYKHDYDIICEDARTEADYLASILLND
jgi:hypothetical protein